MQYITIQSMDSEYQGYHDISVISEAQEVYRELSESGIFKISWQQFLKYWFISQSDKFYKTAGKTVSA